MPWTEPTLFAPTLAALTVSAHHVLGSGWALSLAWRWEGQPSWPETQRATYSHLSTAELEDVVLSELENLGFVR